MEQDASKLPGMTRNFGNPANPVVPFTSLSTIKRMKDRKIILLATATITVDNIFSNGLFQNVYVIYKMFDAMGYAPMLLINEKPKNMESIPKMLQHCRMMVTEDILKQPLPVIALIELGMSIDPLVREFVKMLGGKLAKLYLGNILNIDIETPIFYPGMYFAHHVIDKVDRIWVSPHYGQHAEYASYLNHVLPPSDLNNMIAPYIWDPTFITRGGELKLEWAPRSKPEDDVIVIMEPNISFQKTSFIPLLAVENWYRKKGQWKGKIIVINGNRIEETPHFVANIKPNLRIIQDGLVEFTERKDIVTAMTTWPSAMYIGHQINNEYNYMTLEHFWCGFPVIHNSAAWKDFGYYYNGNNVNAAAEQIELAWQLHSEKLEAYRAHSQALSWRHSPYNPAVQKGWEALLKV
jgi:hypothetical protein